MDGNLPSSNPRRILVRGVNWLGDAVMATPALARLREKFPDAHIALLTPEKLRELWLHHPAVNETISFNPKESVFSVGRKLSKGKFDLGLVLPNSPRSAIEVFLAGIPQRIGHARPWRNFFLTRTVSPRREAVKMHKRSVGEIKQLIAGATAPDKVVTPEAHQIYEYLHLVAAVGAKSGILPPHLSVAAEELSAVRSKFGMQQLPSLVVGLNAGAEYGPAKRWPEECFVAAAAEIHARSNCALILFGGKNDVEMANRIGSAPGVANSTLYNVAGKTSLRELMALMKLCNVLLTNDTGPMHVAAALGVPVVVPFGSTSPELTAPGLPGDSRHRLLKSDAPCSPCFLRECPIDFRCMNGIQPGLVVEAALEILGK